MKNIFLGLSLVLSLSLMPVKKAEAIVGLATGNPSVAVVGGTVMVGTYVGAKLTGCHAMGCLAFGIMFLAVEAIGLIILDHDGDVSFEKVAFNSEAHKHFPQTTIDIYNSELDQLNAVKETIVEEVKANPNTNIQQMWVELGDALSPETMEVATFNGQLFIQSLR